MTTPEAAQRWGKSPVSMKQLCTGVQGRPPRLTMEECRKSGRVWLVTHQGMERLYGPEPEHS
ncbi:MAG TPA: helix-turn-helix domain-containing protein [Veillonellaceae bacterium]|nr:helix-turn-helix domain-containing protein [Veillonellaceae bacterium]